MVIEGAGATVPVPSLPLLSARAKVLGKPVGTVIEHDRQQAGWSMGPAAWEGLEDPRWRRYEGRRDCYRTAPKMSPIPTMITAIATRSKLCPSSTLISASSSSILMHHPYPECRSLTLGRKSVSRFTSRRVVIDVCGQPNSLQIDPTSRSSARPLSSSRRYASGVTLSRHVLGAYRPCLTADGGFRSDSFDQRQPLGESPRSSLNARIVLNLSPERSNIHVLSEADNPSVFEVPHVGCGFREGFAGRPI